MKKNQFALIFLTVLTMLAVWYFKTASNKQGETPTLPVTNVSTRTEELAKLREAVRSERNAMLVSLNNIIADESATLVSKTSAIEHNRFCYCNCLTKTKQSHLRKMQKR